MPKTNEQENLNLTDEQCEKIRSSASDDPQENRNKYYDGREPLEYPGHEALAQFLAVSKPLREFKTNTALAKHFNVTRMTVHRWMQDIDVLKRADRLSIQNMIVSKLDIRREWPAITAKMVEMAKTGNIAAMKLCLDCAWGQDQQSKESRLKEMTMEELLAASPDEVVMPSHSYLPRHG